MIISDQHKFVFIHIPKNAGMLVRSSIQRFDDTEGKFTNQIDKHPVLGKIDYVHLPLNILKKYFPEEYRKVEHYESFAILRDPLSRFVSSFSQHLRQTNKKPLHALTNKEIKRGIYQITDVLVRYRQSDLLPFEYIHFMPQHAYVYYQEKKVVKNLFTVEQLDQVAKYLSDLTGELISFDKTPRVNPSYRYKNDSFRFLVEVVRPLYGRVKNAIPKRVLDLARSFVFNEGSDLYKDLVLQDALIKDFVYAYYAKDFNIYAKFSSK